ncbi:hypothetical protein GCM10008910_21560 [Faecalicatena orotica]|uniref:Metallo-beta-lactamase superfamily protein n=1 Tax=Faecalicatena orotica TaxID=1544 RepID=A0A2Y9BBV0_9FIRM|nr:hypothetical protein [Faecalicatena orotica]PWJ32384.1 hypothetical protein A8806_101672 [Faecalicatena orotica]SSA54218.1 hypothetical protein SAMN05216536_101672 [Faecalicatena orotica]
MKITALVENESKCELKSKHGLSLYIETQKHKILFDIGPDRTLFENAKELEQYSQTQFYTCHCTGTEAFHYLSQKLSNLFYLSCGETVRI